MFKYLYAWIASTASPSNLEGFENYISTKIKVIGLYTPSFVGFISISCNFFFVYYPGLHFYSIIIHFSGYSTILSKLHFSTSDPRKLKRVWRLGCYLHPFVFSLHAYLSRWPHLPGPGASDK